MTRNNLLRLSEVFWLSEDALKEAASIILSNGNPEDAAPESSA